MGKWIQIWWGQAETKRTVPEIVDESESRDLENGEMVDIRRCQKILDVGLGEFAQSHQLKEEIPKIFPSRKPLLGTEEWVHCYNDTPKLKIKKRPLTHSQVKPAWPEVSENQKKPTWLVWHKSTSHRCEKKTISQLKIHCSASKGSSADKIEKSLEHQGTKLTP